MDISYCNDATFHSCSSQDSFQSVSQSLETELSDAYNDVPKNFNVVHINAQSIPAHYADLLSTFSSKNIHAILVSETFLNPHLPSTSYALSGFQLIRNDRVSSSHGGVAIYLRSHISYSIVSRSPQPPPPGTPEHLFLEVTLCHSKVLLGVYYSPSLRVDYFDSFENLLEDLCPTYCHSIIMGDFNTCLLKNDARSRKIKSIVSSCNLHILPVGATHYAPNCTPSLLDLMIVSSVDHVEKHGQFTADGFSYHDLIYLSYKIRPPKCKPKTILQRNFRGIDTAGLFESAEKVDWSVIDSLDSVDEQVCFFNGKLLELYDVYAPLRPVRLKHLPAPWLTEEITKMIKKKNRAKSQYKANASDVNKDKYHHLRNRCNTMVRDAQRRHIHRSVENGDPAKVWSFLRSIGVGKSLINTSLNNLNVDHLNSHFTSSASINSKCKSDTLQFLSSRPLPNYSSFIFNLFSAFDVKRTILSIDSNAVGSDNISRAMIVPLIDLLAPVIAKILNTSISSGIFPSSWKDAHVIPLPKKANPVNFSDLRPISILSFISKVLEKLVHSQLVSFLTEHNLFNPFQSGFRTGHSTTTALVKITDDIRLGMENQEVTILTLLDFSNAFNTVNFDILLAILRSLNISPTVIDWFRSYIHGRRQRIRVEDTLSSWCDVTAGVPQGGVLSPLLFSLFIHSITSDLSSSYHLYADDLQIYCRAKTSDLSLAIGKINYDLDKICAWSRSFGLNVNPQKTQAIIIGSSRIRSRIDFELLPTIIFDGVQVPLSETVRNLGVLFDGTMSWKPHVAEVSRRVFAAYSSLRRLKNFLPTKTKITLAQSLLLPIIDYADTCYPDLSGVLLNKIDRLQNLFIRFIFGLRKFDHISHHRSQLKWLPIRRRRDLHVLSLLYSILFNRYSPVYLKERFVFRSSVLNRSLRISHDLSLDMPPHSTDFYSNSFTIHAVRLWNSLPISIRQASSIHSFKRQLKTYFLNS